MSSTSVPSLDPPKTTSPAPRGRFGYGVLIAICLVSAVAAYGLVRFRVRSTAGGPPAPDASARPVSVTIVPVVRTDVDITLDALGNAVPLATVTVKSQVDGRLEKTLFQEGKEVKRGEVLAQVDARPYVIQLHNAEAALARDEAQLRNAQLNLDRYTTLRSQNLIAQQQVDDQRTQADQLNASVMADRAQVENARLLIDYARITSPIEGVTGVRQVDPGNLVHPSDQTGIVVVTQLDPMGVIFTLPQDDLPRVSTAFAEGPLEVEARSRDGATKLGAGTVALIDNQVSATTATVRLKAVLPNPDRRLWPNAFVKVRLKLGTRRGATVVASAAVQRGPQGAFVYVVRPDQTVEARPVEVETTTERDAVVSRGLNPGENVVLDGQTQLRPGARVSPRPADSGPRSGAPSASASVGSEASARALGAGAGSWPGPRSR